MLKSNDSLFFVVKLHVFLVKTNDLKGEDGQNLLRFA